MKRYIKVYKEILRINFVYLLTYRANFFNSLLSSIAWGVFSVVSILIITTRVSSVFGWSRQELIMLTACYGLLIGIFHTVFSANFDRMARLIFFGQLDPLLLKPIDAQFSLSLWLVSYSHLSRILIGLITLLYLVYFSGYSITLISVSLFLGLIVLGVVMLYSIWLTVCTLLIWFPQASNLVELLFSVAGMSRYPPEMYRRISGLFFVVVIPLVFAVAVPLKALLGKVEIINILITVFLCFLLTAFSRNFWKYGLRHYTSAN